MVFNFRLVLIFLFFFFDIISKIALSIFSFKKNVTLH